ncbi:ABC transporter permease [Streptomyces acidiscabies]|uniref:ABC transporter permease n=1 Tax=Streptomyces acidiscabies TaxID=42234 RepID=UPI00067E31BF|nr:ABC transporter permease [Streptomyces acidiscabies]
MSQQTPSPQVWQQGGVGYTSPIPVVRTHLGHAIASEWTKIRSVRSTMWTLGVFVVMVVGVGLLTALLIAANAGPEDLQGDNPLSYGVFGLLLGSMCVITLGVLTTASEYGTGMIRTTMVACPSRGRVLAAKGIVFFGVAFAFTFVSTLVVALADVALLDGARTPSTGEWVKGTFGVSLFIALLGLLSLAVGSVVRHSAGAITIMIGLVLAPLVLALFMFAESLSGLRDFLFEYSIPNLLSTFYAETLTESGPSAGDSLLIALVVTGAVFGAGFALLESRDV